MKIPSASPPKHKAVIYCRVSTVEQVDNFSLETQESHCRKYCAQNHLTVDRVFVEEGESAKTADRTEFQKMYSYCKENKDKIGVIVFYSISRFSRSLRDFSNYLALYKEISISLRSVTEPIDDSSSGKLQASLLAAFAEYDNNLRGDRSRTGMYFAFQKGHWTFKPPLGYKKGTKGVTSSIVPDPERAPHIQKAFAMIAGGLYSIQSVLQILNKEGFTTRKGKKVTIQTFRQLLSKKAYIGMIESHVYGETNTGDFEPLVEEHTFLKAQFILKRKTKIMKSYFRINPDFPLKKFVLCPQCKKGFTGSWSKGRKTRYPYYHIACKCVKGKGSSIPKNQLENSFKSELELMKPNQGLLTLLAYSMRKVALSKTSTNRLKINNTKKSLQELIQKRSALEERYVFEKDITRETYQRLTDKLEDQIGEAKTLLNDLETCDFDIEEAVTFAEQVMNNPSKLWEETPMPQKQRLQYLFFPRGIEFLDGKFKTADKSLIFSLLEKKNESEDGLVTLTGLEPVRQP